MLNIALRSVKSHALMRSPTKGKLLNSEAISQRICYLYGATNHSSIDENGMQFGVRHAHNFLRSQSHLIYNEYT